MRKPRKCDILQMFLLFLKHTRRTQLGFLRTTVDFSQLLLNIIIRYFHVCYFIFKEFNNLYKISKARIEIPFKTFFYTTLF